MAASGEATNGASVSASFALDRDIEETAHAAAANRSVVSLVVCSRRRMRAAAAAAVALALASAAVVKVISCGEARLDP